MANRVQSTRRVSFQRGERRKTVWVDVATTESTLVGAPTVVLINSASAGLLDLRPFTIVRVRGYLFVTSDQFAATESYGVAMGAAVVSDQAVAIGVTAVPTPVTDKQSDLWFVFENLFSRATVSAGPNELSPVGIKYDSKAMRKVEDGQDIIFTLENEINGVRVLHSARMLIKLH